MGKTFKRGTIYLSIMAIVSSLYWSAAAPAAAAEDDTSQSTSNASLRTSFPDVPISHWASKHITKLSLLGIIEGDDSGDYKPEDEVTQEQVVTMAIRMMGLEDEAEQSNEDTVLPFDVQDYAKPYVSLAIDQKLINIQEELEAGSGESDTWGSKEATREWVAKIVVRAIGRQSSAMEQADTETIFTDDEDISSSAVGYVNEAVDLEIVDGFDDGSFQPEGIVTRAQMATFLSRAEKYLETRSERVFEGVVSNISSGRMTLLDKLGVPKEFTFRSNTAFFTAKDDTKRISPANIEVSNEVYVIHLNGTAYMVDLINDELNMESIEGKLLDSSLTDLTVTLEVDGNPETYKINADVSIVNNQGAGLSFVNLVKGSIVELKRNTLIENANVSHIIVKREPTVKNIEAVFVKLDGLNMELTSKATGETEVVELEEDTAITYNGQQLTPVDLVEGDVVNILIVDDAARTLNITSKFADMVDEGSLKAIDSVNKFVTIDKDGDLDAYVLGDLVEVVIPGIPYATLQDLTSGDQVRLEMKDSKIVRVRVLNRNITPGIMATVLGYEPQNRVLTVQHDTGDFRVYVLSEKTDIWYNTNPLNIDLVDDYFTSGKRVELTVSENNVLAMRLASSFEGKVTNKTASSLTIQTANNTQVTFTADEQTDVDMIDKPGAKITDVSVGDYVIVRLNSTQDVINTIIVERKVLYKVVEKKDSINTITVQNQDTRARMDIKVDNSFTIERKGTSLSYRYADIREDQNIMITHMGDDIEKITLLDSALGRLSAVDKVNNKITVTNYNGTVQSFTLGQSFKVYRQSVTQTDLSTVNVDDRAEVGQDIDGNYYISILPKETRAFASYDVTANKINFKRRSLNDKISYIFHEDAYIHVGSEEYNPNFLKENDEVTIYLLDDEIIELEKLVE